MSYVEKNSLKAKKILSQSLLDNEEDYEVQLAKLSYWKLTHDDSMSELVVKINQRSQETDLAGSD